MLRVSDTNACIAVDFATIRSPFAIQSAPFGQVVPVVLNDSAVRLATPEKGTMSVTIMAKPRIVEISADSAHLVNNCW